MNYFSKYRFTLDIQKNKSQVSIPVHYKDTGNVFYITLTDGGNPYIIPDGCRVDIYIKKPNSNIPLVNACIVENNSLVRYEFNATTANVEGMHKCELRLYNSEGRLITTPSFVMVVDQRVVYDDEIGSEEDFAALNALGVIANEEARIAAEEERKENENNRIEAEVARDKAEKERAEAEEKRENGYAGKILNGYDLVITTEDEFDKCLYPLYKDEDNLTRDRAVLMVEDDSAFNEPSSDFTARRILIKGVTFKKNRGYDDVRLHIFHPSIEYIKFENCRWEAQWKVSGENPRDPSVANYNLNSTYTPDAATGKPRATAFNRATNTLRLTIEGLHVTEDNVAAAPVPSASNGWGIGLRNLKALRDCHIEYPADYRIPAIGHNTFEITCQFFDFADTCSLSALWDGINVSNCTFTKLIKRCHNIANVKAISLKDASNADVTPAIDSCSNLINVRGNVSLTNCTSVGATKEEVLDAATTAENNAKEDAKKYLPLQTRTETDLTYGGVRLYGVDAQNKQVMSHARDGYNKNEIAMRDNNGRLSARPSDYNQDVDEYYGSWHKQTLMPKDYIDKKLAKGYAPIKNGKVPDENLPSYAPLESGKVPSTYLPSYVDDVIEGYLEDDGHFYLRTGFMGMVQNENGKIYVDVRTNKSYRWSGSKYVEISSTLALGETSSTAYYGDRGKEAYDHSQATGNPHGTTAANVGAVAKLQWSASGNDYRVYAQDNLDGETTGIWASESATHSGADKTIAIRNASGQLEVASPSSNGQATNKGYVDGKIYTTEATDNNGAYGAAFSDDRYFAKPKLTDMITNAYHVKASYITVGQNNKRDESTILIPKDGSVTSGNTVPIRDANGQLYVKITPTLNGHATSKKYVDDYVASYALGESFEKVSENSLPNFTIPLFDDGTLFRGVIFPVNSTSSGSSFEVYIPPMSCSVNSSLFMIMGGIDGVGWRRALLHFEVHENNLDKARCTLKYFNADDDPSQGTTSYAGNGYKVIGKLVHA